MELRRTDFMHGHKKSLSSSPVEKYSTNAIITPQRPFIQKEIPNPPETWDSYISTATNSGLSSVSCILPTDDTPAQIQETLNTDKLNDQLSFPVIPQQFNELNTASSDFVSIPEIDKNLKLDPQQPELNVSILWEYLKLHQEKCSLLQEQMSRILEQQAVPHYPAPNTALVPKNDSISNGVLVSSRTSTDDSTIGAVGRDTENSKLLECLQAQKEKSLKLEVINQSLQERIQVLQEENQKLQDRNDKLINFLLRANENSFEKINNRQSPRSLNTDPLFSNAAGSLSIEEGSKHCTGNNDIQQEAVAKKTSPSTKTSSSAVGNIEIRQEKEIEKTSTSTMTSVIYDGSDKVVYKKLTTVTTDFKKQCNELSAQCSVNKEAVVSPQCRPSSKRTASSSQKKQLKCRKCGKCSPRYSCGKSKRVHNVSSGALENERVRSAETCSSEIEDVRSVPGKKEVHNTEPKQVHDTELKQIISPRYEKILRNVNELVLNFEEDAAMPRVRSRGWKSTPSSRAVDYTPKARKSENHRYSDRRLSSNSSSSESETSTLEVSSKEQEVCDNITGSTTISVYGLSSPNLSESTRQYLDTFGLVRDSSRASKSRTTLAKRYLR